MSLSFAALTPHSPLLIPSISRENIQQVSATIDAYKKISKLAAIREVETFVIISAHNPGKGETYLINQCPKLEANFEEFGDLVTQLTFETDIELSYKIREYLETKKQVALVCETNLDYSTAIPMYYFSQELPKARVIPLYTSSNSLADHYELGKLIKYIVNLSTKKTAVIAAGDLSHALEPTSPAGFAEAGKQFDDLVMRILKNRDKQLALEMEEEFLLEAKECISRPLLTLLGTLDEVVYESEVLAYESPFAIGFLTAHLKLT